MTDQTAEDIHTTDGSDSPAWKRLIGSSTPDEVISLVQEIVTEEIEVICGLGEDDAQAVIRQMSRVIGEDIPGFQSALSRICASLVPSPLRILNVRDNQPFETVGWSKYAFVWKGEHEGRHVSVKEFRQDLYRINGSKEEFFENVEKWQALCHQNVVPLLGVIFSGLRFATVSEWMVNGNINEYIKTHPEKNPFHLLQDVARGLLYLHDQGIIHGGLKGPNILVDQEGHARLTDFRIAPIYLRYVMDNLAINISFREASQLADPEYDADATSEGSDCYALGMVIYEALAGHPPFAEWLVQGKVRNGERPERPGGMGWFTDDLWEMLGQCWAKEANNRPSIETVCACLEQASGTWEPLPPQVNEGVNGEGKDSILRAQILV